MTMMEFDKELTKLQIMFNEQEDGGCERARYTDERHLLKAVLKSVRCQRLSRSGLLHHLDGIDYYKDMISL